MVLNFFHQKTMRETLAENIAILEKMKSLLFSEKNSEFNFDRIKKNNTILSDLAAHEVQKSSEPHAPKYILYFDQLILYLTRFEEDSFKGMNQVDISEKILYLSITNKMLADFIDHFKITNKGDEPEPKNLQHVLNELLSVSKMLDTFIDDTDQKVLGQIVEKFKKSCESIGITPSASDSYHIDPATVRDTPTAKK